MRISGGVEPGGNCLSMVCEIAVTWAFAVRMSTFGWKKTLTMPTPLYEFATMCSMSLTVVVSARWNGETIRPAIWSGGRPVYCQTTPMTGMRISGKMSVGVRSAASGPMISRRSASTTKVYGRLSAMRTSAIMKRAVPGQAE